MGLLSVGCGDSDAGGGGNRSEGPQAGTTISLADGAIEGEAVPGARRFLGIPFAAPPVGELRWRPPSRPEPWEGVLTTRAFASGCPQGDSINGKPSTDEDCLYLNVWAPAEPPSRPLPVLFWIHGGGNQSGSAADEVPLGLGGLFYDGRTLVETRDVVVVSTNYRLGVFGFFAHPELGAEDPERPVSGNQGLLDQRLALEWVRDNIGAFGGDPDNVTVFGESAGSFDTCMHVVSPGSRGLFHRAISQSGGCTTAHDTLAVAQTEVQGFVEAVGCATDPNVLGCLRGKPVEALLIPPATANEPAMPLPGGPRFQGTTALWDFNPIIDGDVLPEQPRLLFEAGDFAKVPYLLGSNSDEGTLFHIGAAPVTTEEEYLEALERAFGTDAATIAATYPASAFESPNHALMRVSGDSGLVCGTYDTARRAAAAGAPVHLYNFARAIPLAALASLDLRATHGAEIAYVFGSEIPDISDEDRELGRTIQGYWSRFAHTGDPNGPGEVTWPPFGPDDDQRLNLDVEVSVIDDFRSTECAMWIGLYDREF